MFVNVIKYKDMKKKAEELIRELVPELQELKEGCKVLLANEVTEVLESDNKCASFRLKDGRVKIVLKSRFSSDSILGSDIHLEHIILAIKTKPNDPYLEMHTKKAFGTTILVWKNRTEEQIYYDYNKPFQEQPEEFYKFLVDILK